MTDESASSAVPSTPTERICFRFVWSPRVAMRAVSAEEKVVLLVSPKFATVHDHVSFQWNLRIHGTTGSIDASSEDGLGGEEDDGPTDYIAVELYFVDGPVSHVDVKAVVAILEENATEDPVLKESKTINMQRGRGAEITDKDRAAVSQYIQEHVGRQIRISVQMKMDAKWFDPYTYLDSVSPTPHKSFLTTNYNARVNSKIWRKRSKKKKEEGHSQSMSRKEKVDYEKKFGEVMDAERERYDAMRVRGGSRRGSLLETCAQPPDHEHLFKKLLVACCESCERRRSSFAYDSKEESGESCGEHETDDDADDEDEEERCFECTEQGKAHVHDLLANLYFNKIVLPDMEYVEDFCDFLIDAELNDLPVLKRACERYLCGELNTKKDLKTSLVLELLFLSIVFHLPVMKSMTLSELTTRTEELSNAERLLGQQEYKNLDKRIRSLSDRNLVELIEQVIIFREQRNRVQTILSS